MKHSIDFIKSAVLSSAEYDDETQELTLTFASGKSYTYKEVAIDTYQDLCNAASAGRYYSSIKHTLVQK